MDQTAVDFEGIRKVIRRVPVASRLELISELFVGEIECIGYELAHTASAQTVTSAFVLANDTSCRVTRILTELESEVALRAKVTPGRTHALLGQRAAS